MGAYWAYVSVTSVIFPLCLSENILAIIPTPSHSHQIAFSPLWRELSLRGHRVTVITTDPQNNTELTNLTEIDVSWSYKYFGNISKMVENSMNMWNTVEIFRDITVNVAEGQLSFEPVQNLIRFGKNFDVVMVETFYPEFLGFAEVFHCPKILITSFDAPGYIHRFVGNPSHPVLHPDFVTLLYGNLSFKERLLSSIYELYLYLYITRIYYSDRSKILHKYFDSKSTAIELLRNVDMIFVNANPHLQVVRALGPSTVTIGGYRRITSMESLPKDVKEFLDSAKEGFIYFSLGSNVKSKDLKKETLTAIIETLKELPYKVLWKFEANELPGKPDNVKLIKWSPQQSVLAHPNIKLFVTQGGLQSMEESIYSEVPLVVMPFFGDQEQNAKLMQSKGIAIIVEVRPYLNKEELKTAMLDVIKNPKYKNAVKRLKELILDAPMDGLEKAVWWTEYVIRNKGAKHLRNPAADIPFYQYYLLDVIGFLLSVLILAISVVFISVRALFRFVYSNIAKNQITTQKKVS